MVTRLNPKDVLKLVADDELHEFCRLLDIEVATDVQRDTVASKLSDCSRTRVLGALVSVNGIWIRMMRDVLQLLETHGVSFRTTGCLLTLPLVDEDTSCHLSPQLSTLIASFDESAYRTNRFPDWDRAASKWQDDLNYWIQRVIRDGEPDRRRRLRDVVRVYIESPTRGPTDMYEDVVSVNQDNINRVFSLWRTLDYLADKLKSIDGSKYPTVARQLSEDVTGCAEHIGREINHWLRDRDIAYEIERYAYDMQPWSESSKKKDLFDDNWWHYDDQWDEWKLFVEDVLALASLESSSNLSDLLQLDTLKDRPRLFEVWCMCQILSMYSVMGYGVELQSLTMGDPPTWNLNYSRATEPVARIDSDGKQWWLFFQLFQTGPTRANMPDLALLEGRNADSDVVWIADPKYSEAGGYRRSDYTKVATRYRDTFEAEQVWICEFFARREWFGGACYEQGERIAIVSEVRPNGEGTRVLNRELRHLHGFTSHQLVLAIDCSGSFTDTLPKLADPLKVLLGAADVVVCFADLASEVPERTFATVEACAKTVGSGTCLLPLVSTLQALPTRDSAATHLVLISDEGFSDSTDEMRRELEGLFAHTETAKDNASLQQVVAKRGLL